MRTVDRQISRESLATIEIDGQRYTMMEPNIGAILTHTKERGDFIEEYNSETDSSKKDLILVQWMYRQAEILFGETLGEALGRLGESQRHKLVNLALHLDEEQEAGEEPGNPPQ
jgi:hypothetical protein